MKNHQYIRNLSVEELAKLLINEVRVEETDLYGGYSDYYESKITNELFVCEEDAVQSTIEWLNAERL